VVTISSVEGLLWITVIGSWALLISQIALFFTLKRYVRAKSFSHDEANFISLGIVLFGTPVLGATLLLMGMNFGLFLWLACVVCLIVVRIIWKSTFIVSDKKVEPREIWTKVSVFFILGWGIYIASSKPDGSIDGMLYHGVTMANVLNKSGLWNWSVGNAYSYYTDLGMIPAAQLARLTPTVQFDDLFGSVYLVLIFFLLQMVIGKLVANQILIALSSLLILVTPVIWIHNRILYVDLMYAVALCTAIYVCSLKRLRNWSVFALGVLSISALIGIKPTGIGIGIALLAVLLFKVALDRDIAVNFALFFTVLLSILGGAAFYIRNFAVWQNPFFPIRYSLAGIELPGIVDINVFASDGDREYSFVSPMRVMDFLTTVSHGIVNGVEKLDYDPRLGGFGKTPVLILISLALLYAAKPWFTRSRQVSSMLTANQLDPGQGNLRANLLLMLILTIFALALQPNSFNSRYVIAPFVMLFVLLFSLILRSGRALNNPRPIAALIFLFILWSFRWNESNLFLGKASIDSAGISISSFNTGVSGGSWQQINAFEWVPKTTCVSIYVDKGPGVTSSGMVGYSVTDLLSYGFFGNRLCNEVHFVTGGVPTNSIDLDFLNRADFVVSFIENKEEILQRVESCIVTESLVNNPESGFLIGQHPQVVSVMDVNCTDD
jgi:hypothetical protein